MRPTQTRAAPKQKGELPAPSTHTARALSEPHIAELALVKDPPRTQRRAHEPRPVRHLVQAPPLEVQGQQAALLVRHLLEGLQQAT